MVKSIIDLDFDKTKIILIESKENGDDIKHKFDSTPLDEDTIYVTIKGKTHIVDYIVLRDGTKVQCLIKWGD